MIEHFSIQFLGIIFLTGIIIHDSTTFVKMCERRIAPSIYAVLKDRTENTIMCEGGSLLSCRPLDCRTAKTGVAVNGGRSPFILTVDWLGWVCYMDVKCQHGYN